MGGKHGLASPVRDASRSPLEGSRRRVTGGGRRQPIAPVAANAVGDNEQQEAFRFQMTPDTRIPVLFLVAVPGGTAVYVGQGLIELHGRSLPLSGCYAAN